MLHRNTMSLQGRVFLQPSEEVTLFSSSAHPIPPTVALQPSFPLPRRQGREAERCPCLSPLTAAPPCASPVHPLPEAVEICSAGAVLVLAEAGSQGGSWGYAACHKLLVSVGCFCTLSVYCGTKYPRALAAPWQGEERGGYQVSSLFLLMAKRTGFAQHL